MYDTLLGGLLGFIILVFDLVAIYEVIQSTRQPGGKLLWILLIFFFPVFGLILYFFFSNRREHRDIQIIP